MSKLAELLTELSNLLSSPGEKDARCKSSSPSEDTQAASTITLQHAVHFPGPDGSALELSPATYHVDILPQGHLLLTSEHDQRHSILSASRTWHELNLISPLALSVPAEHDEQNIVVLLPGGGALRALGSVHKTAPSTQPKPIPTALLAEALFKWLSPTFHFPHDFPSSFPFNPKLVFSPWLLFDFGTIEPSSSPAGFAPMIAPPNWVSATVVNCYCGPAGGYGPPVCAFTPGENVIRGPFAGYTTSVTPVTVTTWKSMVGHVVQLLVNSVVANVGHAGMLYSTWMDVYQIVPATDGPLTFPGVVLATGRSASNAPYTSWVPDAATTFTTTEGSGTPVSFELCVDGITIATRACKFNAQFYYPQTPAGPILLCQ